MNLRDPRGKVPLAIALQAYTQGQFECAMLLIEQPACELDLANEKDFTLPMFAASRSLELLELLARRGQDLRVRTGDGVTPALAAARAGKLDCLQFLWNAGALAVGDIGPWGQDAAMLAASGGRLPMLAFLAACGADLNAADPKGRTCLELAAPGSDCAGFIVAWRELRELSLAASPRAASGPGGRL